MGTAGRAAPIVRGLPVVAMSVQELAIARSLLSPAGEGHEVVAFDQVVNSKIQSTGGAFPVLSLEEACRLARQVRVPPQPARPVRPIAIVYAFRALNLRVSPNRFAGMPVQDGTAFDPERPRPAFQSPILGDNPACALGRVTTFGPAQELGEHQGIHPGERAFRRDRGVVVNPAAVEAVEALDEFPLGLRLRLTDDVADGVQMSLLRCLAGRDDGLVAERSSPPITSGVRFPNRVLAHPVG